MFPLSLLHPQLLPLLLSSSGPSAYSSSIHFWLTLLQPLFSPFPLSPLITLSSPCSFSYCPSFSGWALFFFFLSSSHSPPTPLVNNHPMVTRAKSGITNHKIILLSSSHTPIPELHSVSMAIVKPEMKNAMHLEYDALIKNNTLTLVLRTADIHPITSKWLFRVTYNKDSPMERYRARLVDRGFHQ